MLKKYLKKYQELIIKKTKGITRKKLKK